MVRPLQFSTSTRLGWDFFHLTAFVGTFPTRFRATLADFAFHLVAFHRATFTDFGAAVAEDPGTAGTAATGGGAGPTRLRAINAQSRAFSVLADAHVKTFLTELRALDTRVDARLVFSLRHNFSLR